MIVLYGVGDSNAAISVRDLKVIYSERFLADGFESVQPN